MSTRESTTRRALGNQGTRNQGTRNRRRMGAAMLAAAVAGTYLTPRLAQATSDTWTGTVSGAWATGLNWTTNPGTVPGVGDTATFVNPSANTTLDLGSGVTIS